MNADDRAPIDPNGAELVYKVVADRIERRIRAGEFPPGSRLPSREELAEQYGVAVMSVRRSHTELEERGLVQVVPGKGVYVTGGQPADLTRTHGMPGSPWATTVDHC